MSRLWKNSGNQRGFRRGAWVGGGGGEVYSYGFGSCGFGLRGGVRFCALVIGMRAGVELGGGRLGAVGGFGLGHGLGRGLVAGCGAGGDRAAVEVGGGDLKSVEENAGAFEIHLVGGDADQDFGDGGLEGVAVDGALDGKGVVGEDLDAVDAVVEAGVLVAQGVGAAADAGGVQPDALVRFGRLVLELWMEVWHGYPPGISRDVIDTLWVVAGYPLGYSVRAA